jgi:hypothetical protein
MLVVKVELHSAITGEVTTLGTAKLINDGSGTPSSGNYRFSFTDKSGREWKSGNLSGFPRKKLLAWDLLYRALCKAVGDRNS